MFILEAKNLVKTYPGVKAVDDVSFGVREGICFGLLGPNGAGKSTTVEMIEGVTPATAGTVLYRGEVAGQTFREEAGIQFQNTALQDFLTVAETLEMFQTLYDRKGDLSEIIEACALGDLLAQGPVAISFYRGFWCPYCNADLAALEGAREAIEAAGGKA